MAKKGQIKKLKALARLREMSELDRIEVLEDRVVALEEDNHSLRIAVSILQTNQLPTKWDYGKVTCES